MAACGVKQECKDDCDEERGRRCMIISDKAPGKCVHLVEGNTENGTKIHLYDIKRLPHDNQVWIWKGNKIFSAKSPGKCLHLQYGKNSNGHYIHLWDLIRGDYSAQEWKLEGRQIVSCKKGGGCWHLKNGSTSNCTKIHIWHAGGENGYWTIKWLDEPRKKKPSVVCLPKLMMLYACTGDIDVRTKIKINVSSGYDMEETVSSELHAEVNVAAEASAIEYSAKMDASIAATIKSNATIKRETSRTEQIEMDINCDKPVYIYQMAFTVTYGDQKFECYGEGFFMSSKPLDS